MFESLRRQWLLLGEDERASLLDELKYQIAKRTNPSGVGHVTIVPSNVELPSCGHYLVERDPMTGIKIVTFIGGGQKTPLDGTQTVAEIIKRGFPQ